jgi:hypothetical protein
MFIYTSVMFNIERCSWIFIEIITWVTAGHYRHGVRFIESRHEIDEKVVKSSQIGDACRLKHYRWVNKHAKNITPFDFQGQRSKLGYSHADTSCMIQILSIIFYKQYAYIYIYIYIYIILYQMKRGNNPDIFRLPTPRLV